jgi:NTP pyrophosphatase (non-canonical NTP hydrolase)
LLLEDQEWLEPRVGHSLEGQHILQMVRHLRSTAPSLVGTETAYELVQHMHQTPHYHIRRGFRLDEASLLFACNHLLEEGVELAAELLPEKPDHDKVMKELADVLGVFFSICVKLGVSPQMVSAVAETNLRETFTPRVEEVRGPVGGFNRSTRAE